MQEKLEKVNVDCLKFKICVINLEVTVLDSFLNPLDKELRNVGF